MTLAPVLASAAILFAAATCLGIWPMRKLIMIKEARHEIRRDSAGWIRTIGGWIVIVLWIMGTWFLATILGDWWATGDLTGAIDRSLLRLVILLEILSALGD